MSRKYSASRNGGWQASVRQGYGRCDQLTKLSVEGAPLQCSRQGPYGWWGQRFCSQHHPDFDGWFAEALRLEKIAQEAIDVALSESRKVR